MFGMVFHKTFDQYGLEYDKEWLDKFVDQSKRNIIAEWDDDGNLIT